MGDIISKGQNIVIGEDVTFGDGVIIGHNCVIGDHVSIGDNVVIRHNVVIGDNVKLGDNVHIDLNSILRDDVSIGRDSDIASNCVIGEYQMDHYLDHEYHKHDLTIGEGAIIRSNTVIYGDSKIGTHFQTGHHASIREHSVIGDYVSAGTNVEIQGYCTIGNYVRFHTGAMVAQSVIIDDCCWIYPYVLFTNDPTPPSDTEIGAHVHPFAIIATNSIVFPGVEIYSDSLVGAGTVVNRNVEQYQVVAGTPARVIGDIRNIRDKETGEPHYPWRYHFDRSMPWKNHGYDKWYEGLDDEMKMLLK